jgi:hypothetical protein
VCESEPEQKSFACLKRPQPVPACSHDRDSHHSRNTKGREREREREREKSHRVREFCVYEYVVSREDREVEMKFKSISHDTHIPGGKSVGLERETEKEKKVE